MRIQSFLELLQPCTGDMLTARPLWSFHIAQLAPAGLDHPHPAANHVITRAVKIKFTIYLGLLYI